MGKSQRFRNINSIKVTLPKKKENSVRKKQSSRWISITTKKIAKVSEYQQYQDATAEEEGEFDEEEGEFEMDQ